MDFFKNLFGIGKAEDRVERAIYRIRSNMDLMGVGVMADRVSRYVAVPGEQAGKMATDGHTIFFDPTFVDSLSDPELRYVLVHDLLHIAYGHHIRMRGKNIYIANLAADYIINGILVHSKACKSGFLKMPEGANYDPQFADPKWHFESVYEHLMLRYTPPPEQPQPQMFVIPGDGNAGGDKKDENQQGGGRGEKDQQQSNNKPEGGGGQQKQQQQQQQQGGGGQQDIQQQKHKSDCQSEQEQEQEAPINRPEELQQNSSFWGEVWPSPPQGNSYDKEMRELQYKLAEGKILERCSTAGTDRGNIIEHITEGDGNASSWDHIRTLLQEHLSYDRTWARPNPIYMDHGYLPARKKAVDTLHVVLDTSGSVASRDLELFLTNTRAICEELGIAKLRVAFVDAQLHKNGDGEPWTEFDVCGGEEITFECRGRGGTNFTPVFTSIDEEQEEVSVLIYFTDSEGSVDCSQPDFPVIWASTNNKYPMFRGGNGDQWGSVVGLNTIR